jgi:4-oxalocrotonate tautomerase
MNRLEMTMPLIQVRVIENVFTPRQKQQMIEKLTDAMVEIEGEAMRGVIHSGDWDIGGQALSTEAVRAMAAGR